MSWGGAISNMAGFANQIANQEWMKNEWEQQQHQGLSYKVDQLEAEGMSKTLAVGAPSAPMSPSAPPTSSMSGGGGLGGIAEGVVNMMRNGAEIDRTKAETAIKNSSIDTSKAIGMDINSAPEDVKKIAAMANFTKNKIIPEAKKQGTIWQKGGKDLADKVKKNFQQVKKQSPRFTGEHK